MDEWVVTGGVFNVGHIVNVVLQTIYIGKFFWWETGYFNTLDITLDRAGYYICWGCLVWVPAFYTYSSYFLVAQPSLLSTQAAIGVAFLGKSLGFTFCARSDVLYFCKICSNDAFLRLYISIDSKLSDAFFKLSLVCKIKTLAE